MQKLQFLAILYFIVGAVILLSFPFWLLWEACGLCHHCFWATPKRFFAGSRRERNQSFSRFLTLPISFSAHLFSELLRGGGELPMAFLVHCEQIFGGAVAGLPQVCREVVDLPDLNGLYHSIEHLNQINLAEMSLWPIEQQAKYADRIARKLINSDYPIFDKELLREGGCEVESPSNATSIGNCAYAALHSRDEEHRALAMEILDVWRARASHFNPQN